MLKELEKVIHKAIDDGKGEPYTPLDLICLAVQEVAAIALQTQMMSDDFDSDDSNNGGDTVN